MNTLSGENTNGEGGKREPKGWSGRKKPTHTLFTPRLDSEPTSLGFQILVHVYDSKLASDFKC